MKPIAALAAVLLAGSLTAGICQSATPPQVGDPVPAVELQAPFDPEARTYLGLGEAKTFTLRDIKAQVVIVEVMNVYCPYCQKDAPAVNQLYRAIQEDPGLKDRVKLFGLAADNSYFETELYRDRYEVPFHLVPDPDLLVAHILGEVRTPHYLVLRLEPGGPGQVVLSKMGHMGEAEAFLDQAARAGGLRQGAGR